MNSKDLLALTAFGAATAATAYAGARVTSRPSNRLWYRLLRKPPQTPPDAAFGIVWPVLYALTAYSGYRMWKRRADPRAKVALGSWAAQLGLNAAWTPLFFGQHRARAALVDLGMNLGVVAAYTAQSARIDKVAAAAMVPSIAWLAFAGTLNLGIVSRNPRWLAG